MAQLGERLQREIGRLDVLVNNAGYGAMGPLLDGGTDALRRQFETNVFSLIGLTRACFPVLRASRGLVVNIGSVSGVLVTPSPAPTAPPRPPCTPSPTPCAWNSPLRHRRDGSAARRHRLQLRRQRQPRGRGRDRRRLALVADPRRHPRPRQGLPGQPHPATEFARDLLVAAQRHPRPRLLRLGNGSRALPLLAALLPKGLLESVLKKRFGLDVALERP